LFAKGIGDRAFYRWIVGGKLGFVLNKFGLIVDWDCETANVYDATFRELIAQFEDERIVLTDTGFHARASDPAKLRASNQRLRTQVFNLFCFVVY
jgi:hypothetical protein